jgi:hypothetical protein
MITAYEFGTLRCSKSLVRTVRIAGVVHLPEEFPVVVGLSLSLFEHVNALTNRFLTFVIEARNLFGVVGSARRFPDLYVRCRSVGFRPLTLICLLPQDTDKLPLLAGKH